MSFLCHVKKDWNDIKIATVQNLSGLLVKHLNNGLFWNGKGTIWDSYIRNTKWKASFRSFVCRSAECVENASAAPLKLIASFTNEIR